MPPGCTWALCAFRFGGNFWNVRDAVIKLAINKSRPYPVVVAHPSDGDRSSLFDRGPWSLLCLAKTEYDYLGRTLHPSSGSAVSLVAGDVHGRLMMCLR